jgi:hypothetical protein
VVLQVVQPLSGVDELALVVPSWAIGPLIFGNPVGLTAAAFTAVPAVATVAMGAKWGSKECRKKKHRRQTQST